MAKEKKKAEVYFEDREKALGAALNYIEKTYGKGTVMKWGEKKIDESIEAISTGCLSLNLALGIGGIPKGRIVEVYGPESSGKTTLALHIVAESQKKGGIVGYVDAEHAMDPTYAKAIGVDVDNLYISQPDNGEQALEIVETMVRCGAIDLVIVDSVAALVPKAEIEGEMGDSHMGLQARLMSQGLRKITAFAHKTGCTVLFINQLRDKIGDSYGPKETTTGGRALKFYASVRIDIRKAEQIKQGVEIVGNHTKVKIVKNKVAPPFKTVEFDIIYGKGISRLGDLIDLAEVIGLVKKSGAWYSHNGNKIGQGKENAKKYFEENPDITNELEKQIFEQYGLLDDETREKVMGSEGDGDEAKVVNLLSDEEAIEMDLDELEEDLNLE